MQEYKVQQNLVDIAFERCDVPKNEKGLQAYKFLVFYRFFEVLSNAYPIFFSQVEKKKFEKVVYQFMRSGAKSNVMWQVPNEFRKFVKKEKHFREFTYIDDLLWFEWIEVKLLMKAEKSEDITKFSFEKECTLSSSVKLKKMSYKVFESDAYEQKGEYFLLAYYDFNDFKVYYREISDILYIFLKECKKNSLKRALKKISKLSGEDKDTVKSFFQTTLEELVTLNVLKERV